MAEPLVIRLPADLWEYCKEFAQAWGVTPIVHPNDFMFSHGIAMAPSRREGVQNYFRSGASHTAASIDLMRRLGYELDAADGSLDVLEFASGYGRMTRHLKHKLRNVRLTCCDIHAEAVNFVEQALGAPCRLSSPRPGSFALDASFDIVIAVSFFSHMPEATFGAWLEALCDRLKPGGHLMFTTHGHPAFLHAAHPDYLKTAPTLPASGYLFAPASEQQDLDGQEYGAMFVTAEFVRHRLRNLPVEEVQFDEGAWWNQDLYVVKRLRQ